MPAWGVWPFYAVAVGIIVWNIVELGFAHTKPR